MDGFQGTLEDTKLQVNFYEIDKEKFYGFHENFKNNFGPKVFYILSLCHLIQSNLLLY